MLEPTIPPPTMMMSAFTVAPYQLTKVKRKPVTKRRKTLVIQTLNAVGFRATTVVQDSSTTHGL